MKNKLPSVNVDYICIGMQKAGTTWLYEQFKNLPQIDNVPLKEIHYFDLHNVNAPTYYFSFFSRIKNKRCLKRMIDITTKYLKGELPSFRYLLNVLFSNYDDNFYLKLFKPYTKIKGDITPSYSILTIDEIKKMKLLCPNAKIVYIIRNPIERAKSGFKERFLYHQQKFNNKKISAQEIGNYFDSDENYLKSDALTTINNYNQIFGKENVRVFFYDKLVSKPKIFLAEIVSFITSQKIEDSIRLVEENYILEQKVNKSAKLIFPAEIEDKLKTRYQQIIKDLSIKYPECSNWYTSSYKD